MKRMFFIFFSNLIKKLINYLIILIFKSYNLFYKVPHYPYMYLVQYY